MVVVRPQVQVLRPQQLTDFAIDLNQYLMRPFCFE
jgi:hypothetical protein